MSNKIWISFVDDNDQKVNGFFEEEARDMVTITIRSKQNLITLPWHKVLKIKQTDLTYNNNQKGGAK